MPFVRPATIVFAWIALFCGVRLADALVLCATPDGSVYAGDAPPKDCTTKYPEGDSTSGKRPEHSRQAAVGLWECDPGFVIVTSSRGNACIPQADAPKGPTMEIAPPSAWCVGCGVKKRAGKNDVEGALERCAEEFPDDPRRQLACVREHAGSSGEAGRRSLPEALEEPAR